MAGSTNLRVEITSQDLDRFSGVSERTGKQFEVIKQFGWFHYGDKHPIKIKIRLSGDIPYAEGWFELKPSSFQVDRYGGLMVEPELKPIAAGK